jgi:hypothetical protein
MTDIIKTKTTAELHAFASEISEAIAFQKATLDSINGELLARYGDIFTNELAAAGKQEGEVSREIDGVKMTFAIKPKVKWDGKKLEAIASTLPWATVTKVFKIEFSVPEKTYKAMTDDGLLSKLSDARTVEYSDPKVVFSK